MDDEMIADMSSFNTSKNELTMAYDSNYTSFTICNETQFPTNMELDNPVSIPTISPEDPRPGVGDEDEDRDDPSDRPKYQLRPQTRELKAGFTSTWIDQDQTGDYDPSEESRKARILRNRLKLRAQQHARPRRDSVFCEDDADNEGPVKVVLSLIVKLTVQSEDIRTKFRDLVRSLPTESKHNHVQTDGYRFRKRNGGLKFTYNDNYDTKRSRFGPDLPEDPTGHPFARGCWECVALGHECPLLADETAWPCSACVDEDNECDLVTAPVRKDACERCKRGRVRCSYKYTLNHSVACQQCMENGNHCVAGPVKDAIRTRARYDRDWANNPLALKKVSKRKELFTCVECREAGNACTFATKNAKGEPCAACKTSGEPCTLEDLIPQPRSKPKHVKNGDERKVEGPLPPSPVLSKRSKPAQDCKGTSKTIETKLCHPIVFNCDEESEGPCHFCDEPGYGIIGMGPKEVEVIEWADGRGLDEISGGHKGDGIENTRICTFCTMNRMSIIMCSKHEMRSIGDFQYDSTDMNDALSELFSGETRKSRKWCSICPTPALYNCRTSCEDDISGCELLLCEHCMVMLTGVYDGDLQKMLPELKDEVTDRSMLGLRADYGLLKQNGLLMRYVLWKSQ